MEDGSSEQKYFEEKAGKKYYIKKDKTEKPGIELTEYSLVFFKAVETALENRKKEFLARLLPNFLSSCQRILEYCPGISAFDGPWERQSKTLSIEEAERFLGKAFFNEITWLFDEKLDGKNLSVAQTEQVLGTFFISSLVKLHGEVMLQGLFHAKLRTLAETLRKRPLIMEQPVCITPGIELISEIFQPNIATAELVENAQQQFESIFQDLQLKNEQTFLNLLILFFLKPFPFEVATNARFIQRETESHVYKIAPYIERLEKMGTISSHTQPLREKMYDPAQNERDRLAAERALVTKHAGHVQTAFDAVEVALRIVKGAAGIEIVTEKQTFDTFEKVIQIKAADSYVENADTINADALKKLNPIFHQYFVAVHAKKIQPNDFDDVFEASAVELKVGQIIKDTTQTFENALEIEPFANIHTLKEMVLVPIAISPRTQFYAAQKSQADGMVINLKNLEIVPPDQVQYKIPHIASLTGRRRFICCYPPDRETLSALLNANPLVKALLLSQIPIAVILQILRVDNDFNDVSSVMWLEPVLALTGFACGVYALRNPKHLVNAPVRIVEALSASSVVLTKSLGIAILMHTTFFPEEGEPGGIDIERFLQVVASAPVAVALLFWIYNSINPNFKERNFSRCARFILDLINYFSIYFGLNQIITIDIIKIMNRIEKVDLSTKSSRILLELLPAIPAVFFAYARVAPIRDCRRNDIYINMSETINTVVLYVLTTVLLTKLCIDLSVDGNLPTAQTNFRRVFFPGLVLASIAVMARFARSFPVLYDGNPEVIIQQVIKERGLQPVGDGTFSSTDDTQRLLSTIEDDADPINAGQDGDMLNHHEMKALKRAFDVSGELPEEDRSKAMLVIFNARKPKSNQQHTANNEGKRMRCCSCAIL